MLSEEDECALVRDVGEPGDVDEHLPVESRRGLDVDEGRDEGAQPCDDLQICESENVLCSRTVN